MHQYRIFTFRDDGHFSCVQRIECADEREAIQKARQFVNREDGELWESDRLIARFPDTKEQQRRAASVGRSEDSSDVALSADVAPLGDSHIDGCDLLQRSVIPYGACKALAGGAMDHAVSRRGNICSASRTEA